MEKSNLLYKVPFLDVQSTIFFSNQPFESDILEKEYKENFQSFKRDWRMLAEKILSEVPSFFKDREKIIAAVRCLYESFEFVYELDEFYPALADYDDPNSPYNLDKVSLVDLLRIKRTELLVS